MKTETEVSEVLWLTVDGLRRSLELLAKQCRTAAETLGQAMKALEPYIEIENEDYTIRFPVRLFPTHLRCFYICCLQQWRFKNFNPPKRQKIEQDKRKHTFPLGSSTYLHKAKEMKILARGTKPHKLGPGMGLTQCKHTFEITKAHCAPCDGYNVECRDYEKHDAANTKRSPKA